MSLLQAIVLGIVQGLTEFLPISSSGHLILVPYFFDWDPQELTFDVALHVGTLLAALLYFRRQWMTMARAALSDLRSGRLWSAPAPDTRLLLLLALGSIPAGVLGVVLSEAEDDLRKPVIVAAMLVTVAGVMWAAERAAVMRRSVDDTRASDSVAIGLAQAMALVPGVSRSGVTISMGLFRGFDRESATRFSFLLATPVTAGAALFSFSEAAFGSGEEPFEWGPFVAGSVTAGVVGFLAIHYLLRYLRFNSLGVFIWYRIALAAVVLIAAAVR